MKPDRKKNQKKKMVVILDDVCGSGSSLQDALAKAVNDAKADEYVVAPLVTTKVGKEAVNKPPHVVKNQHFAFMAGLTIEGLGTGEYYQSLGPAEQELFGRLRPGLGYGSNDLSVIFPYMAPDNNNSLASHFTPFYLLNQAGDSNGEGTVPSD